MILGLNENTIFEASYYTYIHWRIVNVFSYQGIEKLSYPAREMIVDHSRSSSMNFVYCVLRT